MIDPKVRLGLYKFHSQASSMYQESAGIQIVDRNSLTYEPVRRTLATAAAARDRPSIVSYAATQ